ncbi:MAG: hypothetical protein V1690_02295 [Candidatus Moraniibacteriota bacterium]
MENKIGQALFNHLRDLDPPKMLAGAILHRIDLEREKTIQRKIILDRFGIAGSILLLLTSIFFFGRMILASEFWTLASLAFSDIEIIAQNWQEFSYSLMETFPTTYTVAILLPVFFFFLFFNSYLSLNRSNHHKHA